MTVICEEMAMIKAKLKDILAHKREQSLRKKDSTPYSEPVLELESSRKGKNGLRPVTMASTNS